MVHHGIAASDRDALRASSACFCSAASTALPSKLQNGETNQGTKMSNQLKSDPISIHGQNAPVFLWCATNLFKPKYKLLWGRFDLEIGSAVGFIGCEISAHILAHHELGIGTIWLSLVELQTQINANNRKHSTESLLEHSVTWSLIHWKEQSASKWRIWCASPEQCSSVSGLHSPGHRNEGCVYTFVESAASTWN